MWLGSKRDLLKAGVATGATLAISHSVKAYGPDSSCPTHYLLTNPAANVRRLWRLRGTPHLWVQGAPQRLGGAGSRPCWQSNSYHWLGDTRAVTEVERRGGRIDWNSIEEITIEYLQSLPTDPGMYTGRNPKMVGDPALSLGLVKIGAPIYLAKWETDWDFPKLLHIRSIDDVRLFGINERNYGRFVVDWRFWQESTGFKAAELERGTLPRAT